MFRTTCEANLARVSEFSLPKANFTRRKANLALPSLFLYRALHIALGGAFCHILALVIELFALAESYLHLYPAALKIQAQRYQRVARLLYDTVKAVDLFFVHKQLSYAHWVAVEDIALFKGRDVHSVDEELALINGAPAVL